MTKTSKHFKAVEFERCTPSCSIDEMDQEFLDKLDALRERCGMPLIINCAYRSRAWDKAKGRSGNSAHTEGKAVDIRCNSSATRMRIVKAALELGFNRVGIEGSFVHIDTSEVLPQGQMWVY